MPETARPATSADSKYVGVVYFHGMGSQRHYEEMCMLVDRLDHEAWTLGRSRDPRFEGVRLHNRSAEVELPRTPSESGPGHDVVYVRATAEDPRRVLPTPDLRFYEAYWAPDTVDGTTVPSVANWITRQIKKPVWLLISRWREYRRLRRAALVSLYRKRRDDGEEDFEKLRARTARLLELYELFQSPGNRDRYQTGSFGQFQELIRREENASAEVPELLRLAGEWRRNHWGREVEHLLGIFTVLIGGAVIVVLLGLLTYWLIQGGQYLWSHVLSLQSGNRFAWRDVSWSRLGMAFPIVLSVLGVNAFLTDFVGDVQQYTTYEETDKLYERRKKVLADATAQLLQVLNDDKCERVVVVAHSLGCAVAVDALLELARANRASGASDPLRGPIPLAKIEHLITYGSPVDKINYFFYVVQSSSGSYEELAEDLRGDIGTPPFSTAQHQPHLHWINFWDKGDIISGPTETMVSSRLWKQEVDNVRVANYVLPDLAGSHGAYPDCRDVLKALLQVILFRQYRYDAPSAAGEPIAPARLGPGRSSEWQNTMFWVCVVLLPWWMVLAGGEVWFNFRTRFFFTGLAGFAVAMHAVGLVVHKLRRRHRRLQVDRVAGAREPAVRR